MFPIFPYIKWPWVSSSSSCSQLDIPGSQGRRPSSPGDFRPPWASKLDPWIGFLGECYRKSLVFVPIYIHIYRLFVPAINHYKPSLSSGIVQLAMFEYRRVQGGSIIKFPVLCDLIGQGRSWGPVETSTGTRCKKHPPVPSPGPRPLLLAVQILRPDRESQTGRL